MLRIFLRQTQTGLLVNKYEYIFFVCLGKKNINQTFVIDHSLTLNHTHSNLNYCTLHYLHC